MEFRESLAPIAASAGEPVQTSVTPSDFEELVRSCGLEVVEHLTREQLHDRYFAGRSDGLTPYTNERLLAAVAPRWYVPGGNDPGEKDQQTTGNWSVASFSMAEALQVVLKETPSLSGDYVMK